MTGGAAYGGAVVDAVEEEFERAVRLRAEGDFGAEDEQAALPTWASAAAMPPWR